MSSAGTKRKRGANANPVDGVNSVDGVNPDDQVDDVDESWSPTVDFAFLHSLVRQISPEAQPCMPTPTHDAAAPDLQVCTRQYEDSFLFEPSMHERPCVNGRTHCESVAMGGPVLKEFLLPSDAPTASSSRPCLVCVRTAIARAHFQALTEQHATANVILQRHCNIVTAPGEYAEASCLMPAACATGLVSPVVLHTRSSYRATTIDGVQGWRQLYPTPAPNDPIDDTARPFLARLAA